MSVQTAEVVHSASPGRRRVRHLLIAIVLAALGASYLAAVLATRSALSASEVGWSFPRGPLAAATRAQLATVDSPGDYSEVLWAARPGGEVTFGFSVHNGGPLPVTIEAVQLPGGGSQQLSIWAGGRALIGFPGSTGIRPFRPFTLAAGGTADLGLTERVGCDVILHQDARIPGAEASIAGGATSPVVVRSRAVGIGASQVFTLAQPVLVLMPYRACR